MKKAEDYVGIIMRDELDKIANETATVYETHRIERLFEFTDGAVVKYEWQDYPDENSAEKYNHRFTLITPPKPNPNKLKAGVIKTIDYTGSKR